MGKLDIELDQILEIIQFQYVFSVKCGEIPMCDL